jgi:hypothetical protein
VYEKMSPKEVIGKFVSFKFMVKDSKHIINLEQGGTSTLELQPVALKATKEKKEEPTPNKRLSIDASKLDNEEMTLIIKSFRQILKQRKGKDYKPYSKRVCYRCGKSGHYIAKYPYASDRDRDDNKKGKNKMENKKYYQKMKGGEAHIGKGGTPTRAPPNPPSARTPPTSPSTKDFSSPTSTTSVSCQRRGKVGKI